MHISEKQQLIKDISNYLNTHDKRYMFLKILFPRLVTRVKLEGSCDDVSFWIVDEAIKLNILDSLEEHINNIFKT